jgi:hypothetical protein
MKWIAAHRDIHNERNREFMARKRLDLVYAWREREQHREYRRHQRGA